MSGDDYLTVDATFQRVTDKAVLVLRASDEEPVWLPRSVVHGADERGLDDHDDGDIITLRVRRWKVETAGMA